MTTPKRQSGKRKVVKAWAIVSPGGVLIGGGDNYYGYTPLCTYSTRLGAKAHLSTTRNDIVVPCTITYALPAKDKQK